LYLAISMKDAWQLGHDILILDIVDHD
jgi:hypothetical protein